MTLSLTITPSLLGVLAVMGAALFTAVVLTYWGTKIIKDREVEAWRRSPEQRANQQLSSPWWYSGEPVALQRVGSDVALYWVKPYGDREEQMAA